jgi:long-subunit fatty acid transport protein
MLSRKSLLSLLAVAVASAVPATALAGGFEYQAAGVPAAGRAGAYAARADDPLALMYNPAQLSVVAGRQFAAGANIPFYESCFTPAGDEPQVCNSASPLPGPYLAFAFQPIPRLGIGVGFVAPAGVGAVRYGRPDGTMMAPDGDLVPTPTRHLLVARNTPQFFPTIGAGYEITRWLRIGAAFSSGVVFTNFSTTLNADVLLPYENDPRFDLVARASGADKFMPRLTGSVHLTPVQNLEIMAGFVWTRGIRSDIDVAVASEDALVQGILGGPEFVIEGAQLRTPQPWRATVGIRYADTIRDPSSQARLPDGSVNDRMTNERWDIELDVTFERNSRVDAIRVIMPRDEDGSLPRISGLEVDDVYLPQRWRDQWIVRLGGDYNVLPGLLALRGGLSFESNGVTRGFEQLSFRPGQRVGLHAGLTYRIGHRFDVIMAYTHIFEKSVTNTEETAQLFLNSVNPDAPEVKSNVGTFASRYNVVSFGLNTHF